MHEKKNSGNSQNDKYRDHKQFFHILYHRYLHLYTSERFIFSNAIVFSFRETVITQEGLEPTLTTCSVKTRQQRTCEICGAVDKQAEKIAGHTWDDPKAADPRCTVCGKSVSELKGGEPPKPTYNLGDIDNDNKITASDARLALRRAVDLENYAEGSPEFLACDIDKDGKVTAGDARIILRIAVDLEKIEDYK